MPATLFAPPVSGNTGFSHRHYAMDTYFYTPLGLYGFEDRAEITAEVGFDATYLSIWDDLQWQQVEQLHDVKRRFGIDVAATYVVLKLDKPASVRGIFRAIEALPAGSTVELAIGSAGAVIPSGDPRGDDAVVTFLDELLPKAANRGIDIILYPHYGFWLASHVHALRLLERVDAPNFGLVFVGYHWFIVDQRDLVPIIRRAMPFIRQASLAGARRSPLGWAQMATIEPLDCGELDNFAIIAALKRAGFTGPIGAQGWDEAGDVYAKLERSLAALRSMEARAQAHPHWAAHVDPDVSTT